MFKNRTLLITGGTGSFGNAVLRRFLNLDITEIRIFSRDEKKQDDMRRKYADDRLKFYIGDVRDYESIMNAVRGVNYIFHSAALKQVPSCEFHPIEAVKTNIIGTENVLTAAINANVKLGVSSLSKGAAVAQIVSLGAAARVAAAEAPAKPVPTTITSIKRLLAGLTSRILFLWYVHFSDNFTSDGTLESISE